MMARTVLAAVAVVVVAWVLEGAAVIAGVAVGLPALAAIAVGVVAVVGTAWAGTRLVGVLGRHGTTIIAPSLATLAASGLYLMPRPLPSRVADGLHLRDGAVMPVRIHERPGDLPPLVAVHGGPGVPFSQAEETAILRAVPDRTVIFYDQIGAGDASRLERPTGYSTARAVADLCALLDEFRLARVVLLGYSAGAGVIETFASEQPDRVEGLVLLSPGSLPVLGRAAPIPQPQARLSTTQTLRLYASALTPRNLFMYLLTLTDPDTAHVFGDDPEMDAGFATLNDLAAGGLTCSGEPPPSPSSPPGHYLHEQLQREPGTGLTPDALRRLQSIPVLLLRGVCDYIPRSEAEYTAAHLSRTRIVDVAGAGHALLTEQPDTVQRELGDFLDGLTRGGEGH